MAVETSLPVLLDNLTKSLSSAPEVSSEKDTLIPPRDGISLLDVKNELLLSYLQNLVFLIILKLRNRDDGPRQSEDAGIDDAVVKKLVELRVYLERGVRPLEGRLKYQIDKVLRAADDITRPSAPATNQVVSKKEDVDGDEVEGGSEDSDDSEEESTNGVALKADEIDELAYRPQPSALIRPANTEREPQAVNGKNGIYRPPRITATVMPTTNPREKEARKPQKSAVLDEFVNTELSTAPLAEPSIGSTILSGGRRIKSEREKIDDAERREYEESNYVRLPKESKKERAKKAGRNNAGYGGEEWRGLGEGLDRIERLTKGKSGGARSMLEKSRKRLTEERPKGTTVSEVGQGFQKRLKTLDGVRRDRGRRS
jgi:U3 small nucleolar ribonucleoprotein protein LCP5